MVAFILPANSASSGGYEIDNSLRYNFGDSPKLIKSGTSVGSTTFTFSAWVKFSVTNFYNFIFCSGDQIGLAKDRTQSGGQFYLNGATGGTYTNSDGFQRDPSAWYHVVVSCNSGTGIIYVNNDNRKGSINIPQLGDDLAIGHFMRTDGVETPQYNYYMDGYMSEVHFVDGTALNPSSFAETNNNGVWIPKDCKNDLTYGTNGFYLQFKETGTSANASGIGADTSGNDNHFTPTNLAATDVTVDTPTNNFATMNPLHGNNGSMTLSEGNLKVVGGASGQYIYSTIGVASGKWYFEVEIDDQAARNRIGFNMDNSETWSTGTDIFGTHYFYLNGFTGGFSVSSGITNASAVQGSGFSDGDVIAFALDLDNGKLWATKNSNVDVTASANLTGINTNFTYLIFQMETNSDDSTNIFNFGNPPFSISSGNADANGYGNFEYAVPSGFYSLCTKNLAEFG